MTETAARHDEFVADDPPSRDPGSRTTLIVAVVAVGAVLLAMLVAVALLSTDAEDGDDGRRSDVNAQGDSEIAHPDAAVLDRTVDGLHAEIDIPTPAPGSYEYPTADLVPVGAAPHPAVSSGASDAPEVFTGWMFVFNRPDRCTDGRCDLDDVGADTPAQGGSYQFAGRIAADERLVLAGAVRLGQDPAGGARLVDPIGAEVHLAVAPHGRTLPGADGWRQLNGPVGNPDYWWAASFRP